MTADLIKPLHLYATEFPAKKTGCSHQFGAYVRKYFNEVRDSRGKRILVVYTPATPPLRTAVFGAFTEHRPSTCQSWIRWLLGRTNAVFQWPLRKSTLQSIGIPYEFTPLKSFIELPVLPLRWTVTKISRGKKVPTFLLEFSFGIVATAGLYHCMNEPAWAHQLEQKIKQSIEDHAQGYDELIASDYRFRKIRKSLERNEFGAKDARKSILIPAF